ncbi:MAG: hypothetical protein WDN26_04830 [Chitinophagaceae bacterium]
MKPLKIFATISVVTAMLFLTSCNSGDDKKAGETVTDTLTGNKDSVPPPPPPTPSGPTSMMVIKHKVANYAKWKPYYDADDSSRQSYGLHNYVVARGTEDSNMILIALRMDDVTKAKQMAASPALKAFMKKAGVTGTPTVDFVEAVYSDATPSPATVRVLVKHKVKDWDAWKKSFDSHKQARIDAGLADRVISHSVDNNKDVSLVFGITDAEKAKAFMNSQDLKDKMKEAGVDGPPSFFYYKVVERH